MKTLLDILDETALDIKEELNIEKEFILMSHENFTLFLYLPDIYYYKMVDEIMKNMFNEYSKEDFKLTDIIYVSPSNVVFCIKKTKHSLTNEITNMFVNNLIEAIIKDEYV